MQVKEKERESKKPEFAVRKHREALKGTPFAETCASCAGCTTEVIQFEGVQVIRCGRGEKFGVFVTAGQAKKCDGKPSYRSCVAAPPAVKRT